jgi:hypothetical protein
MLIRTMRYTGRDLFESMLNYGLVVNHHSTEEEEGGRSGVRLVLGVVVGEEREIIWRRGDGI